MKKFYFRFRILLMTLTLGLASVFITNGTLENFEEISVNLPQTSIESPLIVFPVEKKNIPVIEGKFATSGCTRGIDIAEKIKKINSKK